MINIIVIALLVACVGCSEFHTNGNDKNQYNANADEMVNTNASADYLADNANDSGNDLTFRRRCVYLLFEKNVKPGMSVKELSQLLHGAKWLRFEDFTLVTELNGWLPIQPDFDNSIIILSVLHIKGEALTSVCIKIAGHVRKDDIYRWMRGEGSGDGAERIMECVVGVDDSPMLHLKKTNRK